MYKLIDTTIITPTHEEAKACADTPAFEGDCKLYADYVEHLAAEMREGRFHVCLWAFTKLDGKMYRINGKHTATAMSMVEGQHLRKIKVCVLSFVADAPEELASLYATFDSMEGSRKARDIYQMFAAGRPSLADIPPRLRDRIVSGLAMHRWGVGDAHHSAKERAELLLAEAPAAVFISQIFVGEDGKHSFVSARHMLRASVLGAMAATYSVSQKASLAFWGAVRDGSDPNPNAASRVLQKYLLGASVSLGRGASRKGMQMEGRHVMYARCIHAWNAHRAGKPADLRYREASGVPTPR